MIFTAYWLDGKKEKLEGDSIAQAFTNAGYRGGALRALDFHMAGESDDYEYKNNRWEWTDKKKRELGLI